MVMDGVMMMVAMQAAAAAITFPLLARIVGEHCQVRPDSTSRPVFFRLRLRPRPRVTPLSCGKLKQTSAKMEQKARRPQIKKKPWLALFV